MTTRLAASGIYLITNTVNGKVYIGATKTFYKRWFRHRNDLKSGSHGNSHLQAAFKKFGCEAFAFSVLFYCDSKDLDFYEVRAIAAFNSINPRKGYNFRLGGDAGGLRERTVSDATRAKMSASNMGHKRNLGIKHSEERKAKISAALKGRHVPSRKPVSDEAREKMSEAMRRQRRANPYSDETRKRMSEAALHRARINPVTDETRKRMSEAARRRPAPSDETRRKLSEASCRAWGRKRVA